MKEKRKASRVTRLSFELALSTGGESRERCVGENFQLTYSVLNFCLYTKMYIHIFPHRFCALVAFKTNISLKYLRENIGYHSEVQKSSAKEYIFPILYYILFFYMNHDMTSTSVSFFDV